MPKPVCFCPGRHMKDLKSLFILLLKPPNSYSRKAWSMCWQSASVRTRWRSILGTSGNWEGGVTTQIYVNLDITATPSESKDQYHAKVGTQGEERTGKEHGNKLLMISCHAERSWSTTKLGLQQKTMWILSNYSI